MEFEMVGGLDQTNLAISFALVLILMIISRLRHILNEEGTWAAAVPVSYTHLTLPTKRIV